MNFKESFHLVSIKGENVVAIYTTFCILQRMRSQIGLEAMLEYMDSHIAVVDQFNPKLQTAVKEALTRVNIEKTYKDARECYRKNGNGIEN